LVKEHKKLVKEHKKSKRRIDLAVAALMAHDRAGVLLGRFSVIWVLEWCLARTQ